MFAGQKTKLRPDHTVTTELTVFFEVAKHFITGKPHLTFVLLRKEERVLLIGKYLSNNTGTSSLLFAIQIKTNIRRLLHQH